MNTPQALVPLAERSVVFYGGELVGVLIDLSGERRIYVPVKPISDRLGLSWAGQLERIKRDAVLNEALQLIRVTRINSGRRGNPTAQCLPLELIPGFLFGIDTARIKDPNVYEQIVVFRREAYRVLWDAFKGDLLNAVGASTEPSSAPLAPQPGVSGAELAYQLATAVASLARQQVEAEARLDGRIDRWAQWAQSAEKRLITFEQQVGPRSPIDDEQAAQLAAAVRTVGRALEQRETGDYRGVYGQLYALFGITSYKNLPRGKFEQALTWLRQWYTELTGEGDVSGIAAAPANNE